MAKWFSGLFGKNKEAEAPTQWVTPASGGKHAANASDDDKTIVVGSRSPGNKIGPGKIARLFRSMSERQRLRVAHQPPLRSRGSRDLTLLLGQYVRSRLQDCLGRRETRKEVPLGPRRTVRWTSRNRKLAVMRRFTG